MSEKCQSESRNVDSRLLPALTLSRELPVAGPRRESGAERFPGTTCIPRASRPWGLSPRPSPSPESSSCLPEPRTARTAATRAPSSWKTAAEMTQQQLQCQSARRLTGNATAAAPLPAPLRQRTRSSAACSRATRRGAETSTSCKSFIYERGLYERERERGLERKNTSAKP